MKSKLIVILILIISSISILGQTENKKLSDHEKLSVQVTNFKVNKSSGRIIFEFSIKNNLKESISHIKIRFLMYNNDKEIINYVDKTFVNFGSIKPNLAKSFSGLNNVIVFMDPSIVSFYGADVLDFKILKY